MNYQDQQYNSPCTNIVPIDGGSKQNEDDIDEYENKEELINNPLYFLKKDENGSKIIQDLYKKSNPNEKNKIFNKIKSEIKELSINKFANYFIVVLIEENDKEKIDFIYNALKGDVFEFSLDKHGTYVIQELLNKLDQNIIEELSENFSVILTIKILKVQPLIKILIIFYKYL